MVGRLLYYIKLTYNVNVVKHQIEFYIRFVSAVDVNFLYYIPLLRQYNTLNVNSRTGKRSCHCVCVFCILIGFGGTSYYTNVGGGSDILCLHSQPRLDKSIASIAAAVRAKIYGIEYGFINIPFSYENNCGLTFIGSDMPCAVCHIQTRTQQILIPARDSCPADWTLEYWGYLVTSYSTHILQSCFITYNALPMKRVCTPSLILLILLGYASHRRASDQRPR